MTMFDTVVIGIVGVSLVLGVWRGVVGELISLAAWVLAFFAAYHLGGEVGRAIYTGIGDSGLRTLAGYGTVFIGVLVAMALVRMLASSLIKALGLSVSDRLLGLFFGLARGVLISMVLVALGGMTSAPHQPWWNEATLSGPLETAVLVTKPWLPDELEQRIRF